MFDTHCHLDFPEFSGQTETILADAARHQVTKILVPSVGEDNWSSVASLAASYPGTLYYALGIHPHFLSLCTDETLNRLEQALRSRTSACLAVGECGLDAMIEVPIDTQRAILQEQLILAEHYALPVILHSRKTHSQLIGLLRRYCGESGGIIHGFSGSLQEAEAYIQLGFKIGVGGTITYPRARKTRHTIQQLPLESLVLETDAPDMPVCGHQGEANHPRYLNEIFNALCTLRDEPRDELSAALWRNSHAVLGAMGDA